MGSSLLSSFILAVIVQIFSPFYNVRTSLPKLCYEMHCNVGEMKIGINFLACRADLKIV